jgi:uncharacterized repeat protein (TIGR01451 family)
MTARLHFSFFATFFFVSLYVCAFGPLSYAQTPTPTQTICPPVYGGGTICADTNILVDKKVKDPESNQYVNNIDQNQTLFSPGDHVFFRVSVTNIGTSTLKNITVMDNLPQFLTVLQTPGTYDNSQRRITIPVDSLNSQETKSFDLELILSPVEALSGTSSTFCLSNQAVARVDTHQSNDTTQFCVQKTSYTSITKGGLVVTTPPPTPTPTIPANTKGGLPVYQQNQVTQPSKSPSTGAEALIVPLLGAVSGVGIFLRRKTRS